MKIQKTVALLACFLLCMLQISAQETAVPLNTPNYNKHKVFVDVPDKQPIYLNELESLFNLSVGSKVAVAIAKHMMLNGTVVSKSDPSDKAVKSVVVKSSTRQGTTFTFTRITEADGSFSYAGRMINRSAGDALEISREGERYVIRKKGVYDIISE